MYKLLLVICLLILSGCSNVGINVVDGQSFSDVTLNMKDFDILQAVNVINSTYGDIVSIENKKKNLLKFGRNEEIGITEATIMTLPSGLTEETLPTTNNITHFASTATTDNQQLIFEGHTIDIASGNLSFVVQTGTLNGQNKTALTTPLYRITRVFNNDSTKTTGTIYVSEDVPFSAGVPSINTAIHLIITAGEQQSQKASTALSSQDYWIVTQFHASVIEKNVNSFASVRMEVKEQNNVFRPVSPYISVGAGDTKAFVFKPYLIVPKNSDIRLRATSDAVNTDVSGGVSGYLAIIE